MKRLLFSLTALAVFGFAAGSVALAQCGSYGYGGGYSYGPSYGYQSSYYAPSYGYSGYSAYRNYGVGYGRYQYGGPSVSIGFGQPYYSGYSGYRNYGYRSSQVYGGFGRTGMSYRGYGRW